MSQVKFDGELERLLRAAQAASARAFAPYSRFRVGAALLLDDGSIMTGANYESASYGLSMCAERVAVFAANMQGVRERVRALAVVGAGAAGKQSGPVTPCGACRQILIELALATPAKDFPIVCSDAVLEQRMVFSAGGLLPSPFVGAELA